MAGRASPARTRVGRPPKEEAAETSVRIIDTAAQLFAAQGFAATSIEQVASACNAGKDTIYRRYPSKIALFEAVIERTRARVLERLQREIEAADKAGDAMARLQRIARWFLAINLDPELIAFKRIALSEAVVFGEDRQEHWDRDPITDRLVALVAAAQAAGGLHPGDPAMIAAHLLHSVVYGPSNEAMLGRTTYSTEEAQDMYFERAWTLFLHGTAVR